MKQTRKSALRSWITALTLMMLTVLVAGCTDNMIVLNPKGPIGEHQKDLIYLATILCSIIIVPVLIMTFVIAWRYRDKASNKAKYRPEWEHSAKLEITWWTIPIIIIIILATVTVRYTHILEPAKPIVSESNHETMTIQVTSLDWKWLFYYPEQGIATVNYIRFPSGVPVRFELTSDAPMNSFWIPQLGGQIYTMSGMAMKLHLQADEPGVYYGSGANFSGKDFASMNFNAEATTQEEFDAWVAEIKQTEQPLTEQGYEQLAAPGVSEVRSFSSFPEGQFERTVTKYAASHQHHGHGHGGGEADNDQKEGNNSHVGQH